MEGRLHDVYSPDESEVSSKSKSLETGKEKRGRNLELRGRAPTPASQHVTRMTPLSLQPHCEADSRTCRP